MDAKRISWFPELSVLSESQMLIFAKRYCLVLCDWEIAIILDKVSSCVDGKRRKQDLYLLGISCVCVSYRSGPLMSGEAEWILGR